MQMAILLILIHSLLMNLTIVRQQTALIEEVMGAEILVGMEAAVMGEEMEINYDYVYGSLTS